MLFNFWYAWTDGEIAARMEVRNRTVYTLRRRTFKAIRNSMSKEAQSYELTYDLINLLNPSPTSMPNATATWWNIQTV
ncbi:hypothetical protein CE91St62_39590 [Lachnospiraceae bacterium]|nr:hypothetical protein CE91St61_39730 [Lachnospiraceae bacterium]BDF39898.1 hypothetical protein CE91St62_39590 [Lachnospiraceae bacterium]